MRASSGELRAGVPAPTVTVAVEAPLPAIVVGEKVIEAPEGIPVAVRLTVPVKPKRAATVTVKLVFDEIGVDTVLGVAVIEKSGDATTSVSTMEWVSVPLVPMTVRLYDPTGRPTGSAVMTIE